MTKEQRSQRGAPDVADGRGRSRRAGAAFWPNFTYLSGVCIRQPQRHVDLNIPRRGLGVDTPRQNGIVATDCRWAGRDATAYRRIGLLNYVVRPAKMPRSCTDGAAAARFGFEREYVAPRIGRVQPAAGMSMGECRP